jgi:hypothetical protein
MDYAHFRQDRTNVKLSLVPDWVGTELVRDVSFERGLLTLRTPEGDLLVWRRGAS